MDTSQFPYITTTPDMPQIRGGFIGKPGSGKTTAALTFPNPLVLDKDNKCPPGIDHVPFYDPAVERKWATKSAVDYGPRTGLINFLKVEGPKFPVTTTLIIDSWTSFMNAFDIWADAVAPMIFTNKKNEVDNFAVHGDRLSMGIEIAMACKALKCNVLILMHEQIERDSNGVPTGGIKPLMKGQFADQMPAHLTSFFRSGWTDKTTNNNGFVWRVKPDKQFNPITPAGFVSPESGIIPATYEDYLNCIKK
jgi:hypothetical protein